MKRNRNPTNKPVMKRYATLDSPIVLLSFSYHPPIVLLLGNGKQYGNNTEWSEGRAKDERKTSERRTKDERMRIGGTRVINLTIIYL